MPNTKPAIEVMADLDNSGTLVDIKAAGYLNLGADAILTISSGVEYTRDCIFEPISAEVAVPMRNLGDLTPTYASSPYFGEPMTNAPLRIRATHDAVTYDLFKGRIKRRTWRHNPGRTGRAFMVARDLLGIVRGQTCNVDPNISLDIDGAMAAVLESLPNVDSSDLDLTDSTRAVSLFWSNGGNVGQLLRDLAISELFGWVYSKGDGDIAFRPGSSFLGTSLGAGNVNWGGYDTNNIIDPVEAWREEDDDDLVTRVEITPTSYNIGTGGVVVYDKQIGQYAGVNKIPPITLAAGEVIGPYWFQPNRQGIQSLYGLPSCLPYIDYVATDNATAGAGSDQTGDITIRFTAAEGVSYGFYLTITNAAAATRYIHRFVVRAVAITDQTGNISNSASLPGTGATISLDSSAGIANWVNPTNAAADDGSYTTSAPTVGQRTRYLKAVDWHAALPGNVGILGIIATVNGKATAAERLIGKLVVAGVIQTATVTSSAAFAATDSDILLGGANDTWGQSLTPADINNAGFGIALYVDSAIGSTISIDSVSLTIYYSTVDGIQTKRETYVAELPLPSVPGGRTVKIATPWNDNVNLCRDVAQQILAIGRYQPGIVRMLFKMTDDAITKAVLNAVPGTLIRYKMPTAHGAYGDNLDDYYRVLRRDLTLQAGRLDMAEFTLMPSYNFRNTAKIHHDTFNRPDQTGGIGNTPTGKAWSGTTFKILNNRAYANSTAGGGIHTGFDLGADDLVIRTVACLEVGSDAGDNAAFVYRANSSNNNSSRWSVVLFKNAGVLSWRLRNVSAGVIVEGPCQGKTTGDPVELELRCINGRHRLFVDRRLVVDYRDETANTGSGNTYVYIVAGLFALGNFVYFDEFYSQALEA